MPTLGLPTPMFLIFVATVLAGSLGAIHYVVVHIILGRPFAEIPPPVLREGGLPEPGADAGAGGPGASGAGSEASAGGADTGGERGESTRGGREDPDTERADG